MQSRPIDTAKRRQREINRLLIVAVIPTEQMSVITLCIYHPENKHVNDTTASMQTISQFTRLS